MKHSIESDGLPGWVTFSSDVTLKPWGKNLRHYIQAATGTINVAQAGRDTVIAGKIQFLFVNVAEVINEHLDLARAFRSHSPELWAAYLALFDPDADYSYRDELNIEARIGEILYIQSVSVDPAFTNSLVTIQAIETVVACYTSMGVAIVRQGTLAGWQLKMLKFQQVPDTAIFFRDNA